MSTAVTMPQLGLTMTQGVLVEWLKDEGDAVTKGEIIFTVENDKSVIEVESQTDGILLKKVVAENEEVPVGTVLGYIGAAGEAIDEAAAPSPQAVDAETTARPATGDGAAAPAVSGGPKPTPPATSDGNAARAGDGFILASPRARALAAERGIDLAALTGSGPDGVIVEKDVPESVAAAGGVSRPASAGAVSVAVPPEGRVEALTRVQSVGARRLTESWQQIPQFTLYADVAVDQLQGLRSALEEVAGVKPSLNLLFIKLAAATLQRHPRLNAHWLGDDKLRLFGQVNVGVAMDTSDGLVVPVLRNCESTSIRELTRQWSELAGRVAGGAARSDDYADATVSLSNLGMFGIDRFRAIINPPQTAILSIGAIRQDGNRSVVTLGLTVDHRAVDGATAARFVQDLKKMIAYPALSYEAVQ